MPDPERPLLASLKTEVGSLRREIAEMLALRWKLARMELTTDLRSVVWLLVVVLVSLILVLSALPILGVALAQWLDQVWGISRLVWLLTFGGGLLVVAIAMAFLTWVRFRRRFVGLEETLEELQEDMLWLREWLADGNDEKEKETAESKEKKTEQNDTAEKDASEEAEQEERAVFTMTNGPNC